MCLHVHWELYVYVSIFLFTGEPKYRILRLSIVIRATDSLQMNHSLPRCVAEETLLSQRLIIVDCNVCVYLISSPTSFYVFLNITTTNTVLAFKPPPPGLCVDQVGEEDVVSPVPLRTSTRQPESGEYGWP